MALKHLFVSPKSDGADATIVQAGDWNDSHVFDAEAANEVLAGPASGVATVPDFRALVDADIPAAIARDSELHTESHDYDTHTGGVPFAEVEYDDATSDPLIDADAASDGTEDSATRKDHVHPKHHAKYTDAEAISAVEGEPTVVLSGDLSVANGKDLSLLTDGSTGALVLGAGGDVQLFRGAASRLDLASGDDFRLVSGGIELVAGKELEIFSSFGDANPLAQLTFSSLRFGAGGASGLDAVLFRGAANRLDVESGDDFRLVSGDIELAFTKVLGIFGTLGDVNPRASYEATGIKFGAGGGSAVDVSLGRAVANRLDLASGDNFRIVSGALETNTISEVGSGSGVTVDSVLLKDGLVDGIDVAARDHAAVTAADAGHTISSQAITSVAASATLSGHAELATAAEVTTGTDTARVIPVVALPVQIQDNKYVFVADTASDDDYLIAPSPAIAAYATGQMFHFTAQTVNTGASTLNVNGKGAKAILKQHDVVLGNGDIEAGQIVTVIYDGTQFQMQSQVANTPGSTDADAIHDNVAGEIVVVTEKTAPVGADEIIIEDSADSNAKKSLKLSNLEKAQTSRKFSYSITVEDPTSSEDISIAFTNRAITITEIRAVLIGSSTPSVTWTIKHHATDRNNAGNAVVTASTTTTSVTTGDDVTAFNDATIPADSYIWLEISAQSGTVTEIHITIIGTVD